MGLDEFKIEFDNPTKSYFPGQNVTGRVIIASVIEKKTQGLKIKFSGAVTVHWEEQVNQTTGTGNNRESRKVAKYFDDNDNLFEFKVYALGDGRSEARIPPGRSVYPFNFALPSMNLPSSYVGEYGKVTYQIDATIKRSWKFDHDIKEQFTVNAIVDLNQDPVMKQPVEKQASKTFCCLCCTSGPILLSIKMERQGFVSGEYLGCVVEVDNKSNRGVNGISAALIQTAIFYAQGSQKEATKTVTELKNPGIDPGDTNIWKPLLQIPSVPPTKLGGCRIIDVQYKLKLELHVSGLAFNLKELIPITVGTIPLQSTFSELTTANNFGGSSVVTGFIPSAPPLYPEMPNPTYHESFNFGPTPKEPTTIVENVTGAVLDNIVPKEEPFAPRYPTYGWIAPETKQTV